MNQTKNTTNEQTNKKSPNECGACWIKTSANSNQDYLSLKIELDGQEYFLKGFLNGKKQINDPNDKKPNWIIYKSNPKENNQNYVGIKRDRNYQLD